MKSHLVVSQWCCQMEEVIGSFAKRLALDEDEVEVVVVPIDLDAPPKRWYLVGDLLTTKPIKVEF